MLLQNTRYGVQHVEFARGGNRAGTDFAIPFPPFLIYVAVSSGVLWGT